MDSEIMCDENIEQDDDSLFGNSTSANPKEIMQYLATNDQRDEAQDNVQMESNSPPQSQDEQAKIYCVFSPQMQEVLMDKAKIRDFFITNEQKYQDIKKCFVMTYSSQKKEDRLLADKMLHVFQEDYTSFFKNCCYILIDSTLEINLKLASIIRIKRFMNQIINNLSFEEMIDFCEILFWIAFDQKIEITILTPISECITEILQRSKHNTSECSNYLINMCIKIVQIEEVNYSINILIMLNSIIKGCIKDSTDQFKPM